MSCRNFCVCIFETLNLLVKENIGSSIIIFFLQKEEKISGCFKGHQRQQLQPHTLALLTPPLCTVDWFGKTEFLSWANSLVTQNPKRGFDNIRDTLFDQKSPVHALPGPGGCNGTHNTKTLQL